MGKSEQIKELQKQKDTLSKGYKTAKIMAIIGVIFLLFAWPLGLLILVLCVVYGWHNNKRMSQVNYELARLK